MVKAYGIIVARIRNAELPDRPNLQIKGKPLWQLAMEKLKDTGLIETVIVCSDSQGIVDAARAFGPSYRLRDILDIGGGTDGECARFALMAWEAETGITLDSAEVVVVPDIGAINLSISDLRKAIEEIYPNPPVYSVASTSKFLPIQLTNYRKGQRVLWHEARSKLNKKGITVNGALYVVRAGILKELGALLTQKGTILPLPKERAIVVSDAWDFLAAKTWNDAIK